MAIKFYIEFGGFYDSWHSDRIDNEIECSIQYMEDEINWEDTHKDYAKKYLDILSDEIGIKMKFLGLWKPRFYNFETDEIEAEISKHQFNRIRERITSDDEVIEWIENASKSRDGFTSFYNGYEAVSADDEMLLRYYFKYLHRDRENTLIRISEIDVELVQFDTVKSIKN